MKYFLLSICSFHQPTFLSTIMTKKTIEDLGKQDNWSSPFTGRYCSNEAKILAGETFRWGCIRKVWIAALRAQIKLGVFENLPSEKIPTQEAIKKLEDNLYSFDWEKVRSIEKETKHDVMAHISYITDHMVPELGQTIHLGMTSEDANANGDILQHNEWIRHILGLSGYLIRTGFDKIRAYRALAMLGETHLQPATAVTLGKRIAMWIGPIVENFIDIHRLLESRRLKGIRGATGTYEALLKLFDNDVEKIKEFETLIVEEIGIDITKLVPGQTSPRDWDVQLLHSFTAMGNNLAKIATDLRHLARTGEIGEPRGKNQVGSSSMPWKQNPMKAERLNSLARLLPGYKVVADMTSQVQGLERTLDDSAGRRVYMPESFLTLDACLLLALELFQGLNVFENVVSVRLNKMIPFLATEEVLSLAVKQGLPRQDSHHFIMQTCKEVWSDLSNGVISENDLLKRLKNDPNSPLKNVEIPSQIDTKNYIGLSEDLCEDFVEHYIQKVDPILSSIGKNTVIVEKSEV